jgi:hypothetical protein
VCWAIALAGPADSLPEAVQARSALHQLCEHALQRMQAAHLTGRVPGDDPHDHSPEGAPVTTLNNVLGSGAPSGELTAVSTRTHTETRPYQIRLQ